MKKICVIIIFVILFNSKAFGKNYNCSILGEAGKVELVKNGNIYKVIFDEKEFWNFKIYQESKELLVIGGIAFEEGEHLEEKEDGVMILLLSKIHKTGKMTFFENTGKQDEEFYEINCKD